MVTGPGRTFISIESPAPAFPWYSRERPRDGSSVRDREMAGAVVAHQDEPLVEIEAVELGVRPAGAEPVEQEHRDVGLEVALAGGRDAAAGEQGVADDEPRAHALGDVVADAAVVVGETVELEVRDEPIEPDGDARRPVEDLGRDLGGDRVGAGVGQIEDLADLPVLALDRRGLGRLDTGDQVVDLEHLDVRAGLGMHLREVGVHVEHPGVRVAEEADARRSKVVNGARGVEPLAQGVPGRDRRRAASR